MLILNGLCETSFIDDVLQTEMRRANSIETDHALHRLPTTKDVMVRWPKAPKKPLTLVGSGVYPLEVEIRLSEKRLKIINYEKH